MGIQNYRSVFLKDFYKDLNKGAKLKGALIPDGILTMNYLFSRFMIMSSFYFVHKFQKHKQ